MVDITAEVEGSVLGWVTDTFTPASLSLDERLRRCAEEMTELCQAGDLPEDTVHKIVTRVYSRPKGEVSQEIAGSGVTLIALAGSLGMNLGDLVQTEMGRVRSKPANFFRKKQNEKADDGVSLRVAYDNP